MRLGLAGGFQKIAENRKLGFDYIEVGVGNITKLSESEFAELAAQNDEATVKIEAASSMLPVRNWRRFMVGIRSSPSCVRM